jgi:hypothetical protein
MAAATVTMNNNVEYMVTSGLRGLVVFQYGTIHRKDSRR